jgi:hypothetical protein
MIARGLVAISLALVPLGPAGDIPLELASVDASAFPTIVVDIVAPVRYSAAPITDAMVEVDGSPVKAVTPVDPSGVVVGVVIDDRPAVDSAVVSELQGASVELVRNSGDGIRVSLGTPSGLRSALTSDRDANIARIAGITAGAPAVVRLPEVITETLAELASSRADDRQMVVVLGGAIEATAAQLAGVAEALTESGTTLHVVAPPNVELGALGRIASRSGGSTTTSPEVLASLDAVTATISNRYRVTTTVSEGGTHRLHLTIGDERYAVDFDVRAPPVVNSSVPSPTQAPSQAPAQPRTPPQAADGELPVSTRSPVQLDVAPPSVAGELPIWLMLLGVVSFAVAGVVTYLREGRGDELDR